MHQKNSMELGKISSKLKVSIVVPVYKKKNYRITAIGSVILRIYQCAVRVQKTLIWFRTSDGLEVLKLVMSWWYKESVIQSDPTNVEG